MLLVIDIGNTNTNIGIFDKNKLVDTFSAASDQLKTSDEYGILFYNFLSKGNIGEKITSVVISSVVPTLEETIKTGVMKFFNIEPYIVSYKSNLPFKIDLKEPKEAGADRIANACAAHVLYEKPCIVIDFGTAITKPKPSLNSWVANLYLEDFASDTPESFRADMVSCFKYFKGFLSMFLIDFASGKEALNINR